MGKLRNRGGREGREAWDVTEGHVKFDFTEVERLDQIVEAHLQRYSAAFDRNDGIGFGTVGRGFFIYFASNLPEVLFRKADDAKLAKTIVKRLGETISAFSSLSFYQQKRMMALSGNVIAEIQRSLPHLTAIAEDIERTKSTNLERSRNVQVYRACALIWVARGGGKVPKTISGDTTIPSRGPFASFVEETFKVLGITNSARTVAEAVSRDLGSGIDYQADLREHELGLLLALEKMHEDLTQNECLVKIL